MKGTFGVALRVLTAEGPAAVRDRILDRAEEWRRRRTFRPVRDGRRITAAVLNILATAPARRLGGIQIQLLRRLELEAEERAYALLYPEAKSYRLERRQGSRRHALELPGPMGTSPVSLQDPAFETAVLRAAEASEARAVHVEGLAGVPPASLLRIGRSGLRVILSLHDFTLFCPRPDLLEQPAQQFCGYCQDLGRCQTCLGHHWNVASDFQRGYRETGRELLQHAQAVIYPSSYLRSKFLDLVPGVCHARQHVIALSGPAVPDATPEGPPRAVRHVAFVGTVHARKGGLVFEDVVRRVGPTGGHDLRWSVFGGGQPDLLQRLSRLPDVSVRGYYRAGTLPRLLRKHDVDLALLLSIIPESYGLTLDECREAGVPVIAFDHGAIAERVRGQGGGVLVPLEAGAAGVLTAVRDVLKRGQPRPSPAVTDPSRRAGPAALAHLRLYRELGVL